MVRPRVIVLRTAGVNCEVETAGAWEMAGAAPDIVHIGVLADSPARLHEYQILTIPGGFSYGDDIAAGRIFASELATRLGETLREYARKDHLLLGICNGFQVLCKSGLLPGDESLPPATVTVNLSRKYEDRWVRLQRVADHCPFLARLGQYELPVAHGEGRVVTRSLAEMHRLRESGCVALQYRSRDGGSPGYPDNPNGSMLDVAGLCDPSGRIFGLMPHPERFVDPTHHPEWTSRSILQPHGRAIFESAVAYFS